MSDSARSRAWRKEVHADARDKIEDVILSPQHCGQYSSPASGSGDKIICICDSYSGALISGQLHGHSQSVWSIAFSPDGNRIVSGSNDRTVIVWGTNSDAIILGPLKGNTKYVLSVAFSPDGRLFASGSADHTIRLRDAYNGTPASETLLGHQGWVRSVAFSPDSRRIASGSGDQTGHKANVMSVAFSPNGCYVVSCDGSKDKAVIIWNAHTGTLIAGPLRGHIDGINAVAFASDGTCVTSGCRDNTMRRWGMHINDGTREQEVEHTVSLGTVALSLDGTLLGSCSLDGFLQIWDTNSGSIVSPLFERWLKSGSIDSVALSPQGLHVAASHPDFDFTIWVWDVRTGKTISQPLTKHRGAIRCIVFSPDSNYLCSRSNDNTAVVWDICTGAPVAPPCEGHTTSILSLAYSQDGLKPVTGSEDATLRVWHPFTGLLLQTLGGYAQSVTSVAFSPSGSYIVSGYMDGKVWRWHAPGSHEGQKPLRTHDKSGTNDSGPQLSDFSKFSNTRTDLWRSLEHFRDLQRLLENSSPEVSRGLWGALEMGPLSRLLRRTWEKFPISLRTKSPLRRPYDTTDGTCILAGSGSTIRVFDTQTMAVVSKLYNPQHEVIHWYPDSANILSVSRSGNMTKETIYEPTRNRIRMWRPVVHDPSSKHSTSSY